jgi:hypothetical protein
MGIAVFKKVRARHLGAKSTSTLLEELVYDVISSAFSARVITSGFRDTGIFPFDPEKQIRLVRANSPSLFEQPASQISSPDQAAAVYGAYDQRAASVVKGMVQSQMREALEEVNPNTSSPSPPHTLPLQALP